VAISRLRRWLKQNHTKELQITANEIITLEYSYSWAALNVVSMAKDLADTFKPYKAKFHRERDMWQGYEGLITLIGGISGALSTAPLFISNLVFGCLGALFNQGPRIALSQLGRTINEFAKSGVGSLTQIARGLTQCLTYPLTLCFRLPLRTFLSKNKEWDKFQEIKSIKRLVAQADDIISRNSPGSVGSMRHILSTLLTKVKKNNQNEKYEYAKKIPTVRPGRTLNMNFEIQVNDFIDAKLKNQEMLPDKSISDIETHLSYFRK